MEHKHRDFKDPEIVCEDDIKEKSLDICEAGKERDHVYLPLANFTIVGDETTIQYQNFNSLNAVGDTAGLYNCGYLYILNRYSNRHEESHINQAH